MRQHERKLWVIFFILLIIMSWLSTLTLMSNGKWVSFVLLIIGVEIFSLLVLIGITSLLIWWHRNIFEHWYVWIVLLICQLTTFTLSQSPFRWIPEWLLTVNSLLLILCAVIILFGSCVALHRHDIAVRLIGWMLLLGLYTMLFFIRYEGGIIQALAHYVSPNGSRALSILGLIFSWLSCLFPLAIYSFVLHSVLILRREVVGENPFLAEQPCEANVYASERR